MNIIKLKSYFLIIFFILGISPIKSMDMDIDNNNKENYNPNLNYEAINRRSILPRIESELSVDNIVKTVFYFAKNNKAQAINTLLNESKFQPLFSSNYKGLPALEYIFYELVKMGYVNAAVLLLDNTCVNSYLENRSLPFLINKIFSNKFDNIKVILDLINKSNFEDNNTFKFYKLVVVIAIRHNRLDVLKTLATNWKFIFDQVENIDLIDFAILYDRIEILKFLDNLGIQSSDIEQSMQTAIDKINLEAIRFCLKKGADKNNARSYAMRLYYQTRTRSKKNQYYNIAAYINSVIMVDDTDYISD